MLCDQCKENPASVFITEIINDETTHRNLCESCAAQIVRQLPPATWTTYPPPAGLGAEVFKRPADCPLEVTLTDPITVRELASTLRVRPFYVIAILMEDNIFASGDVAIAFNTARRVCARFGITARKISPGESGSDSA